MLGILEDGFQLSPVIEQKAFLLHDTNLFQMAEEGTYIKKEDEDEFSADSWETASTEELDEVMEFSKALLSPDVPSVYDENQFNFNDVSPKPLTKKLEIISSGSPSYLEETTETRAMKREKNRLAARRCRQKQKDRIDYLEKDVKEIETANLQVENEIRFLQHQLKELTDMLLNHNCVLQAPKLTHYREKYAESIPCFW